MVTNRDLISDPSSERNDHIFVVTGPPNISGNIVTVRVDYDAHAAVHDPYLSRYPDNPTVSQITGGSGTSWLLSGGALITDQHGKIAVGLRDGNARDPFMFTNIGAGRCDRKLKDHCDEEVATEFLLCVKDNSGIWRQAAIGPPKQQLLLCNFNKPAVGKRVGKILPSIFKSGGMVRSIPQKNTGPQTNLPTEIAVEWFDPTTQKIIPENLYGYVLVDYENKTTEFRFALQLGLDAFPETAIFFGEGTGYAEWLSLAQICALARAETVADRDFLTPFLRVLGN